jgi:hypothetical protein
MWHQVPCDVARGAYILHKISITFIFLLRVRVSAWPCANGEEISTRAFQRVRAARLLRIRNVLLCCTKQEQACEQVGLEMANPKGRGGFAKGVSGNPAGRPKRDQAAIANVAVAARQHAGAALATLVKLLKSAKTDAVRLGAAREILDRAFGRPIQALQVDGTFATKKLSELTDVELAEVATRLAATSDDGQLGLFGSTPDSLPESPSLN